jgi:hypothetical protein
MIGALRPQPIREREITLEVAQVHRSDCGQLVDDHVRLGSRHRRRDLIGIKRVRDHRHPPSSSSIACFDSLRVMP